MRLEQRLEPPPALGVNWHLTPTWPAAAESLRR
jgi:hypothetical protein